MAKSPRRPDNSAYYEAEPRVELFSQGDLFRDVPLAYPTVARELVLDDDEEHDEKGARTFLSGPLDYGPAILITPSCSMSRQGAPGYAHPVRTLVPIRPLDELVEKGHIKHEAVQGIRDRDQLLNYMYLPPLERPDFELPESLALLYMPITLHHEYLEGQRVAQLAYQSTQQLQMKLVRLFTGLLPEQGREAFNPPID